MMPFIKIQLEPSGSGIRREDRLCLQCGVGLNCHLAFALEALLENTRYDNLAVKECDLFEKKEE